MNLADFKNLFFIHSTVDQAAIIAKHLEHKCFFTKGEILYELTEDKSYEKTTGLQVQNKLLIIVAKLISESYNNFIQSDMVVGQDSVNILNLKFRSSHCFFSAQPDS